MGCNAQLAGTQNGTGQEWGGRGERTHLHTKLQVSTCSSYDLCLSGFSLVNTQTDTQTSDRLMLLAQPAKAKDHADRKVILGMVELCAKILQIMCTRFRIMRRVFANYARIMFIILWAMCYIFSYLKMNSLLN